MQNAAGIGNFQKSNPSHIHAFEEAIDIANAKLNNLIQNNCYNCNQSPLFYERAFVELVPNFVELKDNYYFDHMNDPVVNGNGAGSIFNTTRPFLTEIVYKAKSKSGYKNGGINWVITNHGQATLDLLDSAPGTAHWQIPSLTEPFSGYVIADLPSLDLNKEMILHHPDGFLRYQGFTNYYAPNNQWWIDNTWLPAHGQLFAHEILHFLGLSDINGASTCQQNIMNNSGANSATAKVSLTGCQSRQIFKSLMTRSSRNAIVCEQAIKHDITVKQNEKWDFNLRILGDVIVKAGATLTVTCEVHMSPNGKFIVERGGRLVVDGGLLTGDCDDVWKGIVVEGDVPGRQSNSGIVELKNEAIIEYARDAVSMNPSHLPWSNDYQNHYGGIVVAENSIIRNCKRGVEFMKYAHSGLKDQSYFKNVVFENLIEGVTDWADDGVTFDACTFTKMEKRGILPYDAEVVVKNGCVFDRMPIGVDMITTYPIIFTSKIGVDDPTVDKNQFLCDEYGVHVQSAGNVQRLKVVNNEFGRSIVGFQQNGNGSFDIQHNLFENIGRGTQFYDCGVQENEVVQNQFVRIPIGANSNKVNTGLQYWGNCFQQNKLIDINNQNGDIFSFQGSSGIGAGNCFEGSAVDIDNRGGTNPFYYYVAQTPSSYCKVPFNPNGVYNYTIFSAGGDPFADCSEFKSFPEIEEDYCEISELMSIDDLANQRKIILNTIQNLQTQFTGWELAYWTKKYYECLEKVDDLVGIKSFDQNSNDPKANKEAAIAYFSEAGDFLNKTTAYGIMVEFGEYNRAAAYLDSWTTENEEERNFQWVQGLNLKFLQGGRELELSDSDKASLYAIANTDGPMNGYARSLYEVLTGERIEVTFAEPLVEDSGEGRSQKASAVLQFAVKSYPNPIKDGNFQVEITGLKDGVELSGVLYDTDGKLIFQSNWVADGIYSIDMQNIGSGVYFFMVTNQEGIMEYQDKIIVVK